MRKFALFIVGVSVLAVASAYRAFLNLFCILPNYDDTGYMLSLIQGFNERGSLYRETFSQYGPFFSEFYWFVGRVLHVPISHDGIRWVVLVLWVGSSVAAGVLACRLVHRVWVALLVQAVCFHLLYGLIGEPGHPISLAAALLAAIALAGNFWRGSMDGPVQALLVGTFLGLLAMTKINLGLFAVAAVGTAWVYCSPPDLFGRVLRLTAGVIFGAMGVLLVKSPIWSPEMRFAFVGLFLCTLGAVLVSAPGAKLEWPVLRRFGIWTVGAFFLAVALSISGALITGTGWSDLRTGMIVRPFAMGDVFRGIPDMSPNAATMALLSLMGAIGWWLLRGARLVLRRRIDLALRLLFVGMITAWLAGYLALWTGLIFVWIAALPPIPVRNETERDPARFGRLLLVLLAVGQLLGVYPVSGAQISIPGFLVALCLVPVLQGLIANLENRDPFRFPLFLRLALPLVVVAGPGVALAKVWKEDVRLHAYLYRVWPPLNLPGAQLLHPDPGTAAVYRCLVENLRHSQPSFVTLPGVNSLYGWAERPPPTGFNVGCNFAFLSRAEQQEIVEVARRCRPIALVFNKELVLFWSGGRFEPSGPLIDFAKAECRSAGSVQGYHLMSLNSEPLPPLTYCASIKPTRPNERSRITVTLPDRIGNTAAAASLRRLEGPELPKTRLPLEERRAIPAEPGASKQALEFTFQNPGPDLTADTLDRCVVQLWNEAGDWVADVPFARLPEERQPHPLSSP